MEKLGIQRKEGKKARVSQPPVPAQESTESSASPHCRADGGCGHTAGSSGWASTEQGTSVLEAKSVVLWVVAEGLDRVW